MQKAYIYSNRWSQESAVNCLHLLRNKSAKQGLQPLLELPASAAGRTKCRDPLQRTLLLLFLSSAPQRHHHTAVPLDSRLLQGVPLKRGTAPEWIAEKTRDRRGPPCKPTPHSDSKRGSRDHYAMSHCIAPFHASFMTYVRFFQTYRALNRKASTSGDKDGFGEGFDRVLEAL